MVVLQYQHHPFSLQMTVEIQETPDFLKNNKKDDGQMTWVCQDLKVDFPHKLFYPEDFFEVLFVKFLMGAFDMVYLEAGKKGVLGVLFHVPNHQAELLARLGCVFSDMRTHIDHRGACTSLYLPTQFIDYDHFIDITHELSHRLDQFLWSQQRFHHSIKQYWQAHREFDLQNQANDVETELLGAS